ncbi:precorrin-4 C(11)-methyltransferase [Salininema proteolyticum]|uniref:Precorrin-4 C(11)-methyltransferase n=1 Tax=Salininema proteolyticum TaxID=1607685 RepID=A0ABV8U4L9_9ACTN
MAEVWFIGAGPGAADLITVRASRLIGAADIVVWASSLVTEDILDYAASGAEIHDSKVLTLEDVQKIYARAAEEDLTVARVHSGDPSLYGAVQEQIETVESYGLDWEIVPGVTSVAATAAAAGKELTIPEVAQSVVFTRMATRTPMPDGEDIRSFAEHGTTMALFLSASRPKKLQAELIAGGYAPETPCVVGYRVSWPEQEVRHCRLDELARTVRDMKVSMHTMVLVGPALGASGKRSHLYSPTFSHTYRQVGRGESQGARDDG